MSTDAVAWPDSERSSRPFVDYLHEWVTTVDHKRLGILYIVYALIFLVIGGIEATVMRIQLIRPHNDFVSPQVFNRMFTHAWHHDDLFRGYAGAFRICQLSGSADDWRARHGVSAPERFQLLDHRVRRPVFFISAWWVRTGLYGAGNAPDVGWFAYAPLTSLAFSPGHSTDYWTLSLLVSGFGSIGTAINIFATIICMRCPGMTLGKMPLLAWLNLVMSGMVLLAVSPLTAAQIMLLIDRYLGGHFFDTQAGGSAVIWMHFFWIFGHPEVYILVIPAFAFVSEIVPVFSRKAIFGYPVMVARYGRDWFCEHVASGLTTCSQSGWAPQANTFFVFSTMAMSVPTGIKIFNWLATMWGGKILFKTPMLFASDFCFSF